MNRIFVISDTHFGHKKILEFEEARSHFMTIDEHDEALADYWCSVVKKKDTVWHLGDVLFGRDRFDLLKKLPGVKKLVMGNHDRYPCHLYLEHFSQVFGSVRIHDCILSHVPIHPSQFYRFRLNIHGHLHSSKIDDPRYVNVSAEQVGFKPVLLEGIMKT